jgi:signal transduction histidine kinase/FixJ family two-component response regulator
MKTNQASENWNLSRLGLDFKNPRWWFEVICIAIIYFVVSWVVTNIVQKVGSSPMWPGAGISVGLLLVCGRSRWLGIFLGTLFLNLHRYWLVVLVPASCAASGSTIGALIIASLILRFTGKYGLFYRVRNVVLFAIFSLFSGTIFQSINNTFFYVVNGRISGENYWQNFVFPWWIGDSIAVLIFAPLVLAWLRSSKMDTLGKSYFDWELVTAVCTLISVGYLCLYKSEPLEYLLLPPLLWSAFRFGARLTTLLVMFVSVAASLATVNKLGIFYKSLSQGDSLLLLQIFMGVITITTMAVLAIVAENSKANLNLQKANAELEQKVFDRTSDLRQSESKALELAARAEAANQAKSTFIANMSHELRSPLNAVLGFSQLMMRADNIAAEHYENASIINRSGDYLLTLINNILDLSKIEAGKITLNIQTFDLVNLLNDVEDMLHLRAANAGINLIFESDLNVPRYICTDPVKLRQVLINLIGNAIKFTKVGSVFIHVTNMNTSINTSEKTSANTDNQECVLNFSVRDTGVGIAAEELSELFEAFSQAQAGRDKQEGTGLGLAISRRFVQLLGGEISVTSELGQGTTFQFQIQSQIGRELIDDKLEKRRTIALEPDQPTYKILVVDDKPINCQLMLKLLSPIGFEVQLANNGQEAIAVWDQWEPHLVLMDMRMPIMDGYEATKYIKSTIKGNATAIIALTASVLEEEKAIVLSAGCDDFIRKPFREQMVFDILAKHLGVKYTYENIQPHESEIDFSSELSVTSENLKVMPNSWIMQLYRSSLEADKNVVINLIGEIPDKETFLVRSLTDLAKKFQFEKLIDLTEPLLSTHI